MHSKVVSKPEKLDKRHIYGCQLKSLIATKRYPTDLTDAEWVRIDPLLPGFSKRGRKPSVDLREVLNAIRYMTRSGGGWRMLPKDFPPWQTVYWWFCRFVRLMLFRTIHDVALIMDCERCGHEASPEGGVLDRWDGCRPPQTASQCASMVVYEPRSGEDGEMKDMMIGVDLAKRVFQVHGALSNGEVQFRKKLTRQQFRDFMEKQAPSLVIFEACGSASYWAREIESLGHEVKLIAPQYVRPFVKRQKNDAADAEAIVIAARQPEMRFVMPKTVEQQARAALFRGRDRIVRQRTEDVNALRAVLYEHGHVFPAGLVHLKRIEALVEDDTCDLPTMIREECRDLLAQIAEKTGRIAARDKQLKDLATQTDTARRLQTMPGVGPLTALAVEAFSPDMAQFKRGRDFAAWLGLVPRQHSSGGKERLGRISKAGQTDIRRLLITGAMTRLLGRARRKILAESWIERMLARKPKMLVVIALANKMARQIWAILTKNEVYKDPALA